MRNNGQTILVINDVEATRDGIEALLKSDGYKIETAQNEQKALEAARCKKPDLMLVSLEGKNVEIIESVRRICENAALNENVPVIIFCAAGVENENEVRVEHNIFLACPDNFNRLRGFIKRLLQSQNASRN